MALLRIVPSYCAGDCRVLWPNKGSLDVQADSYGTATPYGLLPTGMVVRTLSVWGSMTARALAP